MTLGTWDPNIANKKLEAKETDLANYIEWGAEEIVESQCKNLPPETLSILIPLMKQSRTFWQEATESLVVDDVIKLIRFFTLAEEHNSQLEAGNDSPVIGLTRALKSRGESLDKTLLLWIRQHSSNRYLPNGSVL
ncbi:Uncharacterised protein [BD1-7 clade bacterium]|uniref:Uncharacterized protein n=1 Tax=BD1-7 clade bacterium TaxID=2029982 RepID=A0A5S9N4W2_9GAMM|nr:Uncharacterised protein [BD1-7 clade bacterium]